MPPVMGEIALHVNVPSAQETREPVFGLSESTVVDRTRSRMVEKNDAEKRGDDELPS
jgi:hypothetical protein